MNLIFNFAISGKSENIMSKYHLADKCFEPKQFSKTTKSSFISKYARCKTANSNYYL